MRPGDGGRRVFSWGAATALALVSASRWLDTPRVEYLAVCAIATAVAFGFAIAIRQSLRWWPLVCAGALTIAVLFTGDAQRRLQTSERAWRDARERSARAANEALAREVRATTTALRSAARRAVEVRSSPGVSRAPAFGQLARLAHGPEERGVILFRGDSAVAWAGAIRVLPAGADTGDAVGIATSAFYLALYATAARGNNRALATALVHAAPPADRLARALSSRVVGGAGISAFAFAPVADGARFPDAVSVTSDDGRPLFLARAVTPERGPA